MHPKPNGPSTAIDVQRQDPADVLEKFWARIHTVAREALADPSFGLVDACDRAITFRLYQAAGAACGRLPLLPPRPLDQGPAVVTLDDDEARWVNDAARVEIDVVLDAYGDPDALRAQLDAFGQLAALVGADERGDIPATDDARQALVRLRDVELGYLDHEQELRRQGRHVHDDDLASLVRDVARAEQILARVDAAIRP
jgi:hypothetical protein